MRLTWVVQTRANPTQSLFAGGFGYQDDGNGLLLLGHRYYDPGQGRFLTQDPIGSGWNWWNYSDNDPLNGVDPEGLSPTAINETDPSLDRIRGNAARRAERGVGHGKRDCEDWIRETVWPGQWPNARSTDVPGLIRGKPYINNPHYKWGEVDNNGHLEPGDIITTEGRRHVWDPKRKCFRDIPGHIEAVGESDDDPKKVHIIGASLGQHNGKRHNWPVGTPVYDTYKLRRGRVRVWRLR